MKNHGRYFGYNIINLFPDPLKFPCECIPANHIPAPNFITSKNLQFPLKLTHVTPDWTINLELSMFANTLYYEEYIILLILGLSYLPHSSQTILFHNFIQIMIN